MITKEWFEVEFEKGFDRQMHVIGRALIVLFKRQTEIERNQNATRLENDRGFTKPDAKQGTIHAKYYIKHNKLEQFMVDFWMKRDVRGTRRIAKYWRQLSEAAQEKSNAKASQYRKISRGE